MTFYKTINIPHQTLSQLILSLLLVKKNTKQKKCGGSVRRMHRNLHEERAQNVSWKVKAQRKGLVQSLSAHKDRLQLPINMHQHIARMGRTQTSLSFYATIHFLKK